MQIISREREIISCEQGENSILQKEDNISKREIISREREIISREREVISCEKGENNILQKGDNISKREIIYRK